VNTVKTHMRHLYDKLDPHRRHEAVEQARSRPAGTVSAQALPEPAAATNHPAG